MKQRTRFQPGRRNPTTHRGRVLFEWDLARLILKSFGVSKRISKLTGYSKGHVSDILSGRCGTNQRFTQLAVAALIEHQDAATARKIIADWVNPGRARMTELMQPVADAGYKVRNSKETRGTAGAGSLERGPSSLAPARPAISDADFTKNYRRQSDRA